MKALEAPKQIVMENPVAISSVSSQSGQTQVLSSTPPESTSNQDSNCICYMYLCFFLPGCIGGCLECVD